MNTYIERLKSAIMNEGYSDEYVEVCIEYAERLLENGLPVIFDLNHLSLVSGVSKKLIIKILFSAQYFYKKVEIPKKMGGFRQLFIPSLELKYLQRWILDNVLIKIPVSKYAMGFCNGKSIVDNAKMHLGKPCIVNMDIIDFFPSVDLQKVFRVFAYYGYTIELSFFFAQICTYDKRLPQGAPTSPSLSNIVCLRLDKRLSALAAKYQANYSRYADDITFSGDNGVQSIIPVVTEILREEGFEVNSKKTRVQFSYQRQEVTGLIINNNRVRVNKEYKRRLYQEIYYCKKFGVSSHLQRVNCEKHFYKEHLYGKAYFVYMVEPIEGEKILTLLDEISWNY